MHKGYSAGEEDVCREIDEYTTSGGGMQGIRSGFGVGGAYAPTIK